MAFCGRGVLDPHREGTYWEGVIGPGRTSLPWLLRADLGWWLSLASSPVPGRAQKQGHRLQETPAHREGSQLCPPRWDSVQAPRPQGEAHFHSSWYTWVRTLLHLFDLKVSYSLLIFPACPDLRGKKLGSMTDISVNIFACIHSYFLEMQS